MEVEFYCGGLLLCDGGTTGLFVAVIVCNTKPTQRVKAVSCPPYYVVIVGRNEEKTNMKVTKTKDSHYRYHMFENKCNIVNVS